MSKINIKELTGGIHDRQIPSRCNEKGGCKLPDN